MTRQEQSRPEGTARSIQSTAARAARPAMTLVEIIVVLLIVAGLMLSVVIVTSLFGFSDVNRAAHSLSTTLHHAYGRAAINGIRYRLVIDLDDHSYWVECSEENPPMVLEEDEEVFARRFRRSDLSRFGAGLDRFGTQDQDEVDAYDPFNLNLDALFDDCTEDLIPRRLASGDDASDSGAQTRDIIFESVMVSHRREPVREGRVEINFFPDGFVEPFIIWLAKDDGDPDEGPAATLTVEPMTGQVHITNRRLEVPQNFAQLEEAR